jgi:hypothetical protein
MKKTKLMMLISGLIISNFALADLNTGLVGYYKFDGNAQDSSGKGYHFVEHGGISYTNGINNQSISFDGFNGYLDSANFPVTSTLTVSYWIKYQSFGEWSRTLGFSLPDSNFQILTKGWGNTPDQLVVENYNCWPCDAWATKKVVTPSILKLNVFDLYTVTYNNGTVIIYKNGVKIATTYDYNGTKNTQITKVTPSNAKLTVAYPFNTNNDTYFKGQIDDLRIYNRVLSDSEISSLYDVSINGTVKNLATHTVSCKNNNTGQIVNLPATTATTYNCESSGLNINTGDNVTITIKGNSK